MDMIVGSWLISKGKGGKDTNLNFKSIDEAREQFKANKFTYADKVTINGKPSQFGIHEINSALPEEAKKWDLELNSKNVDGWIKDVTKKHGGKVALGLADKIKNIGNDYTTTFGFTLGLSDTIADVGIRNNAIKSVAHKIDLKDPSSIVRAFVEAGDKSKRDLSKKLGEDTMLGIGIVSGGSKGIGNTSAITLMPGIVSDADDRPIPIPILKSYSEGLDTSSYWAAAHGARGGNIKKSVSSFKPGWLTKDLINSMYNTRINSEDPVDTEGLEYSVSDRKGIANRFLAKEVKDSDGRIIAKRNDVVNSDLINKLNQSKIKTVSVQSPLTDPTPGDGFSSWSYGLTYDGKMHNRGDNIGVISAHTITEPSLNMAMKSFHTGGAVESAGKKSTGTVFDVLDRTLKFTKNLPDKATLASIDGIVKKVSKSSIGGFDVVLSDGSNEEMRYVAPDRELLVSENQAVKKGDKLSDGTPSAHDMIKYKGIKDTQKFLVDELSKINENLDKRDIETIVRGISNTTRVMNPGSSKWVPGDVAPLTSVEYFNKNNSKEENVEDTIGDHLAQDYGKFKAHSKIGNKMISELAAAGVKRLKVYKDRIKHEPFLISTGIQAKASTSEDWISRLAHNRLSDVLTEGATQAWKSEINEISNPLTKFVTGTY
jgi:DNA-directed RNA polymerase subunit beta'